jgi:hypothetical protein
VSAWGRAEFGDPCRVCGFAWDLIPDAAGRIVERAPEQMRTLLAGEAGDRRHPDLEWSLVGYVCHVGDSIRIWAERVASVALGTDGDVAPYDQDELARARHYDAVDLAAALWSLERSVGDWHAAMELVGQDPFVMGHEELGSMELDDVVRIRAHDVVHHMHDIRRILQYERS